MDDFGLDATPLFTTLSPSAYTLSMFESLSILSQNQDFLFSTYNIGGMAGVLIGLALFDFAVKGWAMWRAARMNKRAWFVALLLINSLGILPILFLLMTNAEYRKAMAKTPTV